MKNQKNSIDQINLENVKINLSKGDSKLITKESVSSRKDLYLGLSEKSSEEQKKFRGFLRRELRRYVNQILGKDRSDAERLDSIQKFLSFYKKHWRITDFKIENFSQSKNEIDLKDYLELLTYVRQIISEGDAPIKKEKKKKEKISEISKENVDSIEEII